MSASCKPWVQLFAGGGSVLLHSVPGIISSCQSAATSKDCKAILATSLLCNKCYSKYQTFLRRNGQAELTWVA